MINAWDAKYVLTKIRFIPYYEHKIAGLRSQLADLDRMITDATHPVSPNGGVDITVDGKPMRIKIHGGGMDSGELISNLITAQQPIEQQLREFKRECATAKRYRDALLECEQKDFVADFLSGEKSYRDLQQEYFVSNAYDRMIRLIVANVKQL